MTRFLELRERLRSFYGKYDIYVKPVLRFVIALEAFLLISGKIGYMRRVGSPVVTLILALICTFLPINATVVLGALLILLHLATLSLEACAVTLLLFLLMFFMYYKFAPKNGYGAVLTPILCCLRVPQIMPTALGLAKDLYANLSMVCGLIVYYFLKGIQENEGLLGSSDEDLEVSKFTVILQQIVGNKELYLMVAAFILTAIVVYVIRKQAIDHAWTIAIAAGNGVNLIVLLVGSFVLDITGNILWIILGTIAAVIVGLVMEFFIFNLDYTRTEHVQFEDDEYYYYVKAVPKVYVSNKEKQVKQINRRKGSGINKKELADEFDIDQELLDD